MRMVRSSRFESTTVGSTGRSAVEIHVHKEVGCPVASMLGGLLQFQNFGGQDVPVIVADLKEHGP